MRNRAYKDFKEISNLLYKIEKSVVNSTKETYPEYDIITPKDAAKNLEQAYFPLQPKYKDYLIRDMDEIYDSDAIFMCNEWELSKGCQAERAFAEAIGINVIYQNV